MITVYISIGNSDDKLTQVQWAAFVDAVRAQARHHSWEVHGEWYSAPDAEYQNACFCVVLGDGKAEALQGCLTQVRERYGQDSIAWAVAPVTEFI
jgi:hypothetical protein